MGKLTGKGKHGAKVGNHPHTNMISNPANIGREYKCRKWELHLRLRDQQLKTTLFYIYRLLYQNLMGNANQKTTKDTHTKKEKATQTQH